MQINGHSPMKKAGQAKKPRRGDQTHSSSGDRIEVGHNQATDSSQRMRRPNGNREMRRRQWIQRNRDTSVHTAGLAGVAGAVAAANLHYPDGRWNLKAIADAKMQEAELATDYSEAAKAQTKEIMARIRPTPGAYVLPEDAKKPWVRDLTNEHFISVDNGTLWTKMKPEELAKNPEANVTSRDLDQLQGKPVKLPNGDIRMKIAVSDVDAFIKKDTPLDQHMDINGSSVYTPDKIYNLIPKELAEDVISLNPRENRFATIIEFTVTPDGQVKDEDVYQAIVRSRAKLDYDSVGAWFDGKAEPSPGMKQDGEILESLTLQDEAAQRLKGARQRRGALDFESNEVKILVENGDAVGYQKTQKNRATELVENCMVTSNEVVSRFLHKKGYATLERVVVPPEKWDMIQDLAAQHGSKLPNQPNGKALADFLAQQKEADPDGYQDLSFSVIKLIGRGEYMAVQPGDPLPGHFGLGSTNYSQCTASIRRGGDRIAARQIKAALAGIPGPYSAEELNQFANNVTEKESKTKKVERSIEKSTFATMLAKRIGDTFDGVVSGVKGDKVWVRIGNPPVEGSLQGGGKAKVGDRFRMRLDSVNVEKGFIDFSRLR